MEEEDPMSWRDASFWAYKSAAAAASVSSGFIFSLSLFSLSEANKPAFCQSLSLVLAEDCGYIRFTQPVRGLTAQVLHVKKRGNEGSWREINDR